MKVREVMGRPYVIERDVKLDKVADMMSENKIDNIIFLEKDKIKGIITEDDLVKNFHKDKKASEVMSKNVITVNAEDELQTALSLMKEHGIKRLPVIDEDDSLVGIIAITDIMANASEVDGDFLFE